MMVINKNDGIFKIIKDIIRNEYNDLKFKLILFLMENLGMSPKTKRHVINDYSVKLAEVIKLSKIK